MIIVETMKWAGATWSRVEATRPKLRFTRHYLHYGSRSVRLTGITLSRQYGRLIDFFKGDWQTANRVQTMFNKQFPVKTRRNFYRPGHVIS